MSKPIQISTNWPGLDGIKRLVIFGDSYSSVGYDESWPAPNAANPLGIPFPGDTWNEPGKPNWVGHFITNFGREPRFDPKRSEGDLPKEAGILVYDYAVGGETVSGVRRQIRKQFLPLAGQKPSWAPWSADDTLFVTWAGINDCAYGATFDEVQTLLFNLQGELYGAGARIFLFIDVPPIHKSPAFPSNIGNEGTRYLAWNTTLNEKIKPFSTSHPDATVLLFSSFNTFSNIIDQPEKFGFPKESCRKAFGEMWQDHLHPTSKVHYIIAEDMAKFLEEVPKL